MHLSPGSNIHVVNGTRLAVTRQLDLAQEELENLYVKMKLPEGLAAGDYKRNMQLAGQCRELGKKLAGS